MCASVIVGIKRDNEYTNFFFGGIKGISTHFGGKTAPCSPTQISRQTKINYEIASMEQGRILHLGFANNNFSAHWAKHVAPKKT